MALSYENYLILFIVSVFVAFSVSFFWKAPKNSPKRTSFLWKFILLDGFAFSSGLVLLVVFLPQSWLNIVSWVVFDFLVSYVFCVEVPGYLKILKFDQRAVKTLEDLREELIKMRYSFVGSLENLKGIAQGNADILKEENISGLLNNFIIRP